MHFIPLVTSQEVSHEVVLVHHIVLGLVLEISQDMALLLPEVDQFLEFHLALGVENIGDIQVVHVSLSLELLSDFGLDIGNRHVQLVQVAELSGVSHVLSVQMENSLAHVSLRERATSSLGKFSCKRHSEVFCL